MWFIEPSIKIQQQLKQFIMYTIHVINNFSFDIKMGKGSVVQPGKKESFEGGNLMFTINGMGQGCCLDIETNKLPGFDEAIEGDNGMIIRFNTSEAYYRYNNKGEITMTVDELGTVHLQASTGVVKWVRVSELSTE